MKYASLLLLGLSSSISIFGSGVGGISALRAILASK